ncbi:MAG: response regulator transcription factor [Halanaerobium sp.]|nr:response regulator transcription factor [Halanaerobium sp.]
MFKILVVDDEKKITSIVRTYLESSGFQVQEAHTARAALDAFYSFKPDLVILDLMLPDRPGEEVCREIRSASRTPVIMLTARVTEEERVSGLNLGADDYLTKPFSPRELIARIRAVLRRADQEKYGQIEFFQTEDGLLQVDGVKREVKTGDKVADLTSTEFDLLFLLMKTTGRVYSREQLADQLWGFYSEQEPRTIDAHIKNLRKKLGKAGEHIKTVYGVGYKFADGSGS